MKNFREDYSLAAREISQLLDITPQGLHFLIKSMKIAAEIKKNRKYIPPIETRKILESRGYRYPKEVITFSVVKGGVGKTILSHSFSIRASQYGAKVLVIDADQQANITQAFGIDEDNLLTLFEIIQGKKNLSEAMLPITSNLHIIPSSMNMSFLDRYLQINQENLATVFKNQTDEALKKYDYIIIDCPPAISCVTAAATLASDRIIMPAIPMKFSLQGLKASLEELANLEKKFQQKHIKKNIVFNRYDARKLSSIEYLSNLIRSKIYKKYMMSCFIRESSEIENCINRKNSIFDFNRKNNAREDLDLFTKEVMGFGKYLFH